MTVQPFVDACLLTARALRDLGIPAEITLDAMAFEKIEIFLDREIATIRPPDASPQFDRTRAGGQWFMEVNGLKIWCRR